MTSFDAVILDIDGTLIFSNDEHAHAFVLAAREIGLAAPPFDEVRRRIGMGSDRLIPQAFGIDADSKEAQRLESVKGEIFWDRFAPDLQPTPGARQLVERFRADGYRCIVATSAKEEDVDLLLGKAGVADLIDGCTSASDVDRSKPAPDIVLAALKLAETKPGHAVMLGDTPYDVRSATRAGVAIVGVRTGGWSDPELQGAAAIYDSPAEILSDYGASPFA